MAKKWNYYNDNDPLVCEWVRQLIKEGLVPDGEVDCRSIKEVQPEDVKDFIQCHFFCGILGWSHALRLAGVPDDFSVWTGSCPCQPFSAAGKRKGTKDERHLWPEFFRLIDECGPAIVFGEQVASKDGLAWLDGVFADLERAGYACGAADLCAAGVGEKGAYEEFADILRRAVRTGSDRIRGREPLALAAADYLESVIISSPHIRQRLYWVAQSHGERSHRRKDSSGTREPQQHHEIEASLIDRRMADSNRDGRDQTGGCQSATGNDGLVGDRCLDGLANTAGPSGPEQFRESRSQSRRKAIQRDAAERSRSGGMEHTAGDGREQRGTESVGRGVVGGCGVGVRMGEPIRTGLEGYAGHERNGDQPGRIDQNENRSIAETGGVGFWSAFDLIPCRDGKARRVESGTFPLAHGVSGRVGKLRGYGNAIVPALAAEFIKAALGT